MGECVDSIYVQVRTIFLVLLDRMMSTIMNRESGTEMPWTGE